VCPIGTSDVWNMRLGQTPVPSVPRAERVETLFFSKSRMYPAQVLVDQSLTRHHIAFGQVAAGVIGAVSLFGKLFSGGGAPKAKAPPPSPPEAAGAPPAAEGVDEEI
jgi:hypothetical protein